MILNEDYLLLQFEEIESLKSIYDNELIILNEENRIFEIKLKIYNKEASVEFTLPPDYPLNGPIVQLAVPWVRGDEKNRLKREIQAEASHSGGEGGSVVYQIVERLREELYKLDKESRAAGETAEERQEAVCVEESEPEVAVYHGEPFVDRKSTFQAHIAIVHSEKEVNQVKKQLLKSNKIAGATHNISAYRIRTTDSKLLQSCDDDGENKASERLLNMMVLMGIENIFVLVSRWFGGIKLGPDRFKHINNTAKDAILNCGMPMKRRTTIDYKSI